MKNVSRKKFLLCFRSDFDMKTVVDFVDSSSAAAPSLAAYSDWENKKIKKAATRTTSSCEIFRRSNDSAGDSSLSSRPSKRSLSQTIKAVLFGTVPIKKDRGREGYHHDEKKSYQWNRSMSMSSKRFWTKKYEKTSNLVTRVASFHSLSSGSPSSFQLKKSKSMNYSQVEKKMDEIKTSGEISFSTVQKRRNADQNCQGYELNLNSGIVLAVVSLAMTVMQGKVVAILFTTILAYFFAWIRSDRIVGRLNQN